MNTKTEMTEEQKTLAVKYIVKNIPQILATTTLAVSTIALDMWLLCLIIATGNLYLISVYFAYVITRALATHSVKHHKTLMDKADLKQGNQ